MTRDNRAALLRLVRAGYSVPLASAKLGLSSREVKAAGERLAAELREAAEIGHGVLRARALELALGGDAALMRVVLAERQSPPGGDLGERLAQLSENELRRLVEAMPADARERLADVVGLTVEIVQYADLVNELSPVAAASRRASIRQELERLAAVKESEA